MKLIALSKKDQNHAMIDPWSLVHLSTGMATGLVDLPLRHALLAALAYEVAEQLFERHPAGKRFFRTVGPESLANALVDTAVFLLGYRIGRRWNETS